MDPELVKAWVGIVGWVVAGCTVFGTISVIAIATAVCELRTINLKREKMIIEAYEDK